MTTPEDGGLPRTATARRLLLALGITLLLAGLVIGGLGVRDFIADFEAMEGGPRPIFQSAAGGFLCIFGLGAINAGTIGAQSRYVAGETMPTVKRSASYLSDGEGIMGVGRTVDDGARGAAATGPFCRSCGVRNDEDARFCDGCGASLA